MTSWEVLVRVQAYMNVEAETQDEAEAIAVSDFDPTGCDIDVVESWEVEQ